VDTGSPSENATAQREKSEARFYQNGIRSSAQKYLAMPDGIARSNQITNRKEHDPEKLQSFRKRSCDKTRR
jgi:hypothetical protein